MENQTNITQIIIDTINTIFETLFSSIDNNLYNILDDITFIKSNIIYDKNFENIFGSSTSDGLLLIANSFLLGFLLYYSIKYLLSHITYSRTESPFSFLIKLILCALCMNFSFSILSFILDLNFNITSAIRGIGQQLFSKNIGFSELINVINSNIGIDTNSINIFSVDGLIKGTISLSLLSLVLSYSFRYVMIKLFILLSPFAFLSLSLSSSSWFFKAWAKNLFSLLFIQILVALVLLILFSLDFSSSNLISKFIYIGGLYVLIKTNSFVKEFIGGVSTTISQNVNNFTKFRF